MIISSASNSYLFASLDPSLEACWVQEISIIQKQEDR